MSTSNYWKKPLTTAELLDEIERIDEENIMPDCIYITPPDDTGDESNEDSGDEDCNDPSKLNHRQLQSQAETNLCWDDTVDVEDVENEQDRSEDERETEKDLTDKLDESIEPKEKRKKITKKMEIKKKRNKSIEPKQKRKIIKKKASKKKRNWKQGLFSSRRTKNLDDSIYLLPLTLSGHSDPLEFLEVFLSKDVLEHLVKHTVMYSTAKNCRLELGSDELLVFIGILYLSGYVPVPRRRMFWEGRDDSRNTLVVNSMRRNRFEEIFRFIHADDNSNLAQSDKMAKLRPLIDIINEKFVRYGPVSSYLSIDESMIPYFGRNGCKQFIKNKPVRFGYKAWVLASPFGYCLNFDIYQGRDIQREDPEKLGLGGSVVYNFANYLKKHYPDKEFSLFFDNFFNNPALISHLHRMGFGGTGTAREDRIEHCPVEAAKVMKKQDRGTYDSAFDEQNNVICVRWNDNNVVTMLSNEYGVDPVGKCSRYSAKEKKKIEIIQPCVIKQYNKYMGGVDQMDNNVANYRIGFRGKKWYMPIMLWMFDVCMSNAWVLSRHYGLKLDNLEFRRQIVTAILQKYGKIPSGAGRKSSKPYTIPENGQHLILTGQQRRRCAICKNKTTKSCQRCDVSLHDKCFHAFHSQR